MSQGNGRSPVWIMWCLLRWFFCENDRPQTSHEKGLSPDLNKIIISLTFLVQSKTINLYEFAYDLIVYSGMKIHNHISHRSMSFRHAPP